MRICIYVFVHLDMYIKSENTHSLLAYGYKWDHNRSGNPVFWFDLVINTTCLPKMLNS